MTLAYESLKERLLKPFALLGCTISASLSLITFALVAELEEAAIAQTLHVEMERYRYRHALDRNAALPNESHLHMVPLPSPLLPNLALREPGYQGMEQVMLEDKNFTVLVGDVASRPYALAFDREHVDARLARLALFLLLGTLLMTFISSLIGRRLAQSIAKPLNQLVREISSQAPGKDTKKELTSLYAQGKYPDNEIGALVRSLDDYAARLYGFMERESHFAADVSHELRTPVAAIRGAAEVLLELHQLPESLRPRVSSIYRNASRLAEILQAMLLLGREPSTQDTPECDIALIIEDIANEARSMLVGRPIQLLVHIAARPTLAADRSLVYVAISNLMRNATAHTQEGQIVLSLDRSSFSIMDTGIGIPQERFPALFKRFEKGEDSPGHGLGLSIVSRITKYLHWELDISSTPGEGTIVTINFPASGR